MSCNCECNLCVVPVISGEYCDHETFQPRCNPDEHIVIISAIYGHMQKGKCIELDTPYFGCKKDVKHVLDSLCSGKVSCSVQTNADVLRRTKPCSRGILVYLDATFACVKGKAKYHIANRLLKLVCKLYRPTMSVVSYGTKCLYCLQPINNINFNFKYMYWELMRVSSLSQRETNHVDDDNMSSIGWEYLISYIYMVEGSWKSWASMGLSMCPAFSPNQLR